ncbi:MAG: hypothetical protein J0L52_05850 [Caulobacterales bacterium]|nr:hypothetical protein [Caulobacterales bacterium]
MIEAKNPGAVRLLLGWLMVAGLTLSALMLLGFGPDRAGAGAIFYPACVAVLAQGAAAMMMAKRGRERLGWVILLTPLGLMALTALIVLALMAVG